MTRASLGWLLLGLAVVAMAAALLLWVFGVDQPFTPDIVLFPVAYLAFALVGAVIVRQRPDHRIGWLALVAGVGGSLVGLVDSYARLRVGLPAQEWAAWIGAVGFPATLTPILYLVLLFPTGQVASKRWRLVAWILAVGSALVFVGNAFTPSFADYAYPNPLSVRALDNSPLHQGGVGWILVVAAAVLATAGLVPRLRRAEGIERQQLKWITYAAGLHGVSWIVLAIDPPGLAGEVAQWVLFATLVLIPVAAGIAILRYRLYDIDVVIRRTLIYGALIAVLGIVYVGLVLTLQAALSDVTGGQMLPVALSTLAIAALFGPVSARVRAVVDRRFYRSRYDAQRTLEAFASRLRDEVELEAVGTTLVAIAGQAVQPTSAGVWLRPPMADRAAR